MQEKNWFIRKKPSELEVAMLRQAINASKPLAALLLQRGIRDFESARRFFNPSPDQLHDPFAMRDMDKAVKRITSAVEHGEYIMVYGDYDVDGTTAVATVFNFLISRYDRVSYYIPDRYSEGYGVSTQGIDFAADNDHTLIIALDCGIKAVDKVAYASEKGIDFIICDHHLPGDELPRAAAILNPLQPQCSYPYKHLSGCGIGFKLLQALCVAWDLERRTPFQYLDLVAIAAACDIVPMTGENRVLCALGISLMDQALRPGLAWLLDRDDLVIEGRLKRTLTVTDIVFKIGPRINAAGRMKHGQLAVDLLVANTLLSARSLAEQIILNNEERREHDAQMLEEALEMLRLDTRPEARSTVLFAPHWHKGVVGIVASRIQDHCYRPTIVLCESNGLITGSARSVRSFDVHAAIDACSDLLINFGGHPAAAGLTLHPDNLESFRSRFESAVAERIEPEQLTPVLEIDAVLEFDDITERFFESMNRLSPFGPHNMRPVFVSHGVRDTGRSKPVGDGTHLKLEVTQGGKHTVKGIAFGMAEHYRRMKTGEPFSVAYVLEVNEFRGKKTIELMVKDIIFSSDLNERVQMASEGGESVSEAHLQ